MPPPSLPAPTRFISHHPQPHNPRMLTHEHLYTRGVVAIPTPPGHSYKGAASLVSHLAITTLVKATLGVVSATLGTGVGGGGSRRCDREGRGGRGGITLPPHRQGSSRRLAAAGKRPIHTGSPGLSTPNKEKKGRGRAGGKNTREPRPRRASAARSLFALGFTRGEAQAQLCEERRERAHTAPRGSEAPGPGHGRSSTEDTRARARDPLSCPRPASALTPVRTACRTLIGYFVSATFGTVEFAGSIF